ncbi:MAG: FtsX-like permease family protein [Zavarzinella sp.]
MFQLFRAISWRYLRRRWERTLLVIFSIALGVATLVSAQMLNRYIEIAAFDSTIPADSADLYISNGEAGVDWSILETIRANQPQGLRKAAPIIFERVALPELDGRPGILLGIEFDAAQVNQQNNDLRIQYEIVNPFAVTQKPILISRNLHNARLAKGKSANDPFQLRLTSEIENFQILAIIDIPPDSPVAPYMDSLVITDVRQLANPTQRNLNGKVALPRKVSRIDCYLHPKTDRGQIQQEITSLIKNQAKVRTPEDNRKSTQQVIGGIKVTLNICSLASLIVGLFIVYNALSVTVAERQHDIGILRSLGATRLTIASIFTNEAIVLGFFGAVLGIPLGVFLCDTVVGTFGDELQSVFINGNVAKPELTWWIAGIAVVAGIITTLFAALLPSIQAANHEPAESVRRRSGKSGRWLQRIYYCTIFLMISAGIGLILARNHLPERIGSLFGMTMVLTGLFLAMPVLVAVLAKTLHPILKIFLGVEARLAADNLLRAPGRTGLVTGALAAGVALMFQTAGVGKSNEVPVREWLDQVIQADAIVFWGNLATANSSFTPMPASTMTDIDKLPGVEATVGFRFYRAEYQGTYILTIAIDADTYYRSVRKRLPTGLPKLELFGKLSQGRVTVVSDNFAEKWKIKVGDYIPVPSPKGPIPFEVVGIGQDYSWNQGTIFIDLAVYRELFADYLVDTVHVFFDPQAEKTVAYNKLRDYTNAKGILFQDRDSVRKYLTDVIERLYSVAYMQQYIIGIVAMLGVVNALLISIIQRRRELGLLQAIGGTRWQVMKSILWEALLMGLLGTILGFAMGLPMEWFLLNVIVREESGFIFELLIPWKESLRIVALSLGVALLAGIIPALRAVNSNITSRIAYE